LLCPRAHNSRQRPSAGSHSSQTWYAILLSYLDHLEIGERRCLDSSSGCCHNSLRMSRLTASFSIVPQPILTLCIPSLTSRSPAYHCGYLNWVIGIVVAMCVRFKAPTCRFSHSLQYFTCRKRATGCDVIHSMHTFACMQLVYYKPENRGYEMTSFLITLSMWRPF